MKMRKFIVDHCTNWRVPCGYSGHDKTIGMAEFVPTVANVRQAVKNFFPARQIDESSETVREMVKELTEYGIFTVPLVTEDEDLSEWLMFSAI